MGTKVKVTGKTKVSVKKSPVKSGSANCGGNGGILNAKMVAIARKRRRKNKNG